MCDERGKLVTSHAVVARSPKMGGQLLRPVERDQRGEGGNAAITSRAKWQDSCGTPSPSYGVRQATWQRVSGFSSFVEQRSCQIVFRLKGERVRDFKQRFLLVLNCPLLELDKAASYPACQV
jgi:hypothetical protein